MINKTRLIRRAFCKAISVVGTSDSTVVCGIAGAAFVTLNLELSGHAGNAELYSGHTPTPMEALRYGVKLEPLFFLPDKALFHIPRFGLGALLYSSFGL